MRGGVSNRRRHGNGPDLPRTPCPWPKLVSDGRLRAVAPEAQDLVGLRFRCGTRELITVHRSGFRPGCCGQLRSRRDDGRQGYAGGRGQLPGLNLKPGRVQGIHRVVGRQQESAASHGGHEHRSGCQQHRPPAPLRGGRGFWHAGWAAGRRGSGAVRHGCFLTRQGGPGAACHVGVGIRREAVDVAVHRENPMRVARRIGSPAAARTAPMSWWPSLAA